MGSQADRPSMLTRHLIPNSVLQVAPGALPVRLTRRRRHFAGFHELLEPAQILSDDLRRLMAQQPGDARAEPSGGSRILQPDADLGATVSWRSLEPYGTGTHHVGAVQSAPANQLVRNLI